MNHEQTTDYPSREQRAAWQILRDSPTVRMLATLAGPYLPRSAARALQGVAAPRVESRFETDRVYFRRRSAEERRRARNAENCAARQAHDELAELYALVARASGARQLHENSRRVARREAMLDDALDDTFPASDPLALVAPGQPALAH